MDENKFWKLIAAARRGTEGDTEEILEHIETRLSKLSDDELITFDCLLGQLMLKSNRWDLWAAAYLDNDGCGDDSFMDWRAGLILSGQKVFNSVLESPDNLARHCVGFCEEFPSIPETVWEVRHPGVDFPAIEIADESDGEPQGEKFDENDKEWFSKTFPKLSKKQTEKSRIATVQAQRFPEFYLKVYLPTAEREHVSKVRQVIASFPKRWDGIYGTPFSCAGEGATGESLFEVESHSESEFCAVKECLEALDLPPGSDITEDRQKVQGSGLVRPQRRPFGFLT